MVRDVSLGVGVYVRFAGTLCIPSAATLDVCTRVSTLLLLKTLLIMSATSGHRLHTRVIFQNPAALSASRKTQTHNCETLSSEIESQ